MTNGTNRVQASVEWWDAFGQYHQHIAEVPVTVHNSVRFGSLLAGCRVQPDGDGVEDITATSFMLLNDEAEVVVRVRDANGDAVRTLFGDHVVNYVSVQWDGTRDDGRACPTASTRSSSRRPTRSGSPLPGAA